MADYYILSDISVSVIRPQIVTTFSMENQIVEAINYIKKISKKKPSFGRLLAHINTTTVNNWDREFVQDTLYDSA